MRNWQLISLVYSQPHLIIRPVELLKKEDVLQQPVGLWNML